MYRTTLGEDNTLIYTHLLWQLDELSHKIDPMNSRETSWESVQRVSEILTKR